MIRGKFLAQDDLDLAGHRFLNWKWIEDIPAREGEDGYTLAIVQGKAKWVQATADGLVIVEWADILNKPTEFTPEAHTHPWAEVTGKPTFVNSLTAGPGLEVSSTTGDVTAGLSVNVRGMLRFFIGAVIGTPVVDVTSDGADIALTLTSADDVLTLIFHSERVEYDTSGSPSIALTAGTDDVPVANYIWIPSDTQVLTVGTAWPTGIDYVPIATVFCQSAASAQTDGLYKVHAWTDHTFTEDQNGHLGHINAWIREQNATWRSGTSISPTLGAAQFDIAISEGVVLQLHNHSFPALTTVASVDPIFVLNDSVTPYKRVANMVSQLLDSTGATLSNRYYSIVVWGVVSEDVEDCQLLVNLPKGSYSSAATAQADSSNYAEYGIPEDFRGCGFLIARLVVKHAPAGNTYTLVESIDLRGSFPTGFGGGSSGSGDHGGLIGLSDPDHPLTALQQSSAVTNMGILWSGTTWMPEKVFRIAAGAIAADFVIGTPSATHSIVMESTGGSQRRCAFAVFPISTPTQNALNLKEDSLASYDLVPTNASTNICESNGIFDALATKEDSLAAYDLVPTNASTNIVESNGVFDALALKSDILTFDTIPTNASTAACESNGIFDALATKEDTLTFDSVPTDASTNPVESNGVFDALATKSGKTKIIHVNLKAPSATHTEALFKFPVASTLVSVKGLASSGSILFHLNERAETTPGTSGTNAYASAELAYTVFRTLTTFTNAGMAANSWLTIVLSSSTVPADVWIAIEYTED